MKPNGKNLMTSNSVFFWIAIAIGLFLSIPLIAMQFTSEVQWELNDFIVMGVLMFAASSLFVFAARKVDQKDRLAIGAICLFIILWIWAELAVGIFTNWGS